MPRMLWVPEDPASALGLRAVTAGQVSQVIGAPAGIMLAKTPWDFPWHVYVGRFGSTPPRRVNARAKRLADALGCPPGAVIRGTALFCGRDQFGRPLNVPDDVLRMAALLGLGVRAP